MSRKIHNVDEQELKESIARLAHFSPTTKDDYGNQFLDYIVLDALSDFGTVTVSPKEIKAAIKKNLLLDFEEDEIIGSAKRLVGKKMIKLLDQDKRFEKPKVQLLENIEIKISTNRGDLLKLEKEVIDEWKNEISDKYDNQKDIKDNLFRLESILHQFISKMFIRHGVETVSLLYPGENKIKNWLRENGNQVFEALVKLDNAFFENIVKIEIPRFFQSQDTKRNQYISNLFNSSFFWHLVQVDEKCSKLLQNITRGQNLILDNNILYSLVGLHGKDALESAHSMLKFANELGYELIVTTKTIDEFQNTLRWQLAEAREKPPLSSSLAKIALEELGENNFITVYWSELVRKGVSIEEFIAEISHLDNILDGLNIGTFNKFRKDIEESEELKDEMSTLRKACGDHINIHVVEHDAFHRILIRKLRKGNKYNFNKAKAWFLTHDHKLPQYSKVARKGQDHLPFCITTNEWIQINRPLLTRTKDKEEFEKSFHVLVTQSYLRSMLPAVPLDKAYNKVLGKLEKYKGMTAEMASRIASDSHFMVSIIDIDDDKKLNAKIENRLIDLNKELRRKNEELILEKKEEQSNVDKLNKKVTQLEDKLNQTKQSSEEKIMNLSDERSSYENRLKELENTIEDKDRNINTFKEQLNTQEFNTLFRKYQNIAYWALFVAIIIIAFFLLVFLFQEEKWNFIANLFDWAEGQSELRKEVFKWVIIALLSLLQILCGKVIWNRLIRKDKKKVFKKLKES